MTSYHPALPQPNPHSIPVAVLSVCSTQYKTVLDALRGRKERFTFEDVEIALKPSVMAFITMNPGYPGRAGARLCQFIVDCAQALLPGPM
jgi:hypothetical protein